jgi:hypothetical protein
MAKTTQARRDKRNVIAPTVIQVRAAMGKAIREVKRDAEAKKLKLVVASGQSWSVPK